MPTAISELYEPLIGRDLEAIPGAVQAFLAAHDAAELWSAVARFAVLAYAPSQHARHAVLAALAAHELREPIGPERWPALLTECAVYAAASRQPWSEPPIAEPPPIGPDQRGDLAELREAVADGDRLRAERWLARRIDDPALAVDLFAVAADDLSDLGHKLIVAVAAWRLSQSFDPRGRFATLRIATWELTARAFPAMDPAASPEAAGPVAELWRRLIDGFVAAQGEPEAAHRLFLLDAAEQAAALGGEPEVLARVQRHLAGAPPVPPPAAAPAEEDPDDLPIYRLARDYAECLQAHALVNRLRLRHPELSLSGLRAAAAINLARSDFEEWSFA